MIYYNLKKSFLRALRVFISSFFTIKSLFITILVVHIILLLFCTNVRAESTSSDYYVYRQVTFNGLDSSTNTYSWDYRIYWSGGLKEGTVTVTQEMYNKNHWMLYWNGTHWRFMYFDNNDTFYIYKHNGVKKFTNSRNNIILANFGYYGDDRSNDGTFSLIGSASSNTNWQGDIEPNCLIATKDLSFGYIDQGTYIGSVSELADNQVLSCPSLELYPNTRF